jgi:hypothetical protein
MRSSPPLRIVCEIAGADVADLAVIEALARLALEARRLGLELRLSSASPELLELITFAGLEVVLLGGVDAGRQPEQREQPVGVEEERQLGDAAS